MATIYKKIIDDWYQQYSDGIYRFILMRIGDHEQAKDLVHDTYVRAFKNLGSFQGDSSGKTWLYQIARNVTIDYLRRKKPFAYMLEQLRISNMEMRTPEKELELHEDITYLYEALSKLRPQHKEVIIFRKINELSTRETAEVLGWKESRVKTNLRRGLIELKAQLTKEGYVHGKNTF